MKRFENAQRVLVKCEANRGLAVNATGTVARLRRADDGAWIALDELHATPGVHPFPSDDSRATHVLAFPEECEPVQMDQDNRGPRERAYDDLISPLMAQIIEVCKDHDIPVASQFELDAGDDGEPIYCTTLITKPEHSEHIRRIASEMKPKPQLFAFTITRQPRWPSSDG